jgi:hypothetical protein
MCFINYLYLYKIKPQINKNMIVIKNKILLSLANSLTYLNIHGITTQYPINAYYVQPNLVQFRIQILTNIKKDINEYSEVMLAQLILLLTDKDFNCPPDIYNLILDKLIEKRKDPTLEHNFELNYNKDIFKLEFKELPDYKKNLLWAEINTDINYPVFRGFGFNFYTINDKFYKEYNLPTGNFILSAQIISPPKYLITGHNIDTGVFEDYKYYGTLPKKPEFPKIQNITSEKIKYTVDSILKSLNINQRIDISTIIIPEKEYTNFSVDKEEELKKKIFNSLKKRFLQEEIK